MTSITKCKHCGKDVKVDWNLCPWCGWAVIRESDQVSGIIFVIGERKKIRKAAETIAGFKAVRDVFVVTGEADITLKAMAPTFDELRAFVLDSVGGVDGVLDTRTYMVVSSLKELSENVPDPGKDPVRTVILLKVDQARRQALAETLIKQKFVEDVLQVTGDADLVVKCMFPIYSEMRKFVAETVGSMPGIREQKTFMAVTIFKENGKATSEVPKSQNIPKDVYFKRPQNEQEIMNVLTNLPRGVPSSLWGLAVDELAGEILKAEYGLTPSGAPLVQLKGKWYRGDVEDASTYLQAYDGDIIKKK
jgi:DNA-binding Lrp family transcriptional regulator